MPNGTTSSQAVSGILLVTIPVSDVVVSARWYRDVLDLRYVREFRSGETIFACGLVDPGARYGIQLRRRDFTPGRPDLRGIHPVVLSVTDRTALDEIHDRLQEGGWAPTRGEHPDGAWVEIVDPDGISLRFMDEIRRGVDFIGYQFDGEVVVTTYTDAVIR